MKKKISFLALVFYGVWLHSSILKGNIEVQDDTVIAIETLTAPIFDGLDTDSCWSMATWQNIDQVWIPWEGILAPTDFSARYKTCWSSEENLLYFFVEVTDDFFADGYTFPDKKYPDFDVVEVFIDEDRSGGPHIFDANGNNGENAFSYHILPTIAPSEGSVISNFVATDISGTGWLDNYVTDYTSHIPDFALLTNGTTYTWEFSLKVYNDSYIHSNPENSRVSLEENKEIGLSIACCENDQDDQTRDNFIGSVAVEESRANSHWESADDYGILKLISEPEIIEPTTEIGHIAMNPFKIFPNPAYEFVNIYLSDNHYGSISFTIYSISGQLLQKEKFEKHSETFKQKINISNLHSGIYFISIASKQQTYIRKITIID